MSRPQPIKYYVDSWNINFYAKNRGRTEQSVIAVINWEANLPEEDHEEFKGRPADSAAYGYSEYGNGWNNAINQVRDLLLAAKDGK